MNLFRPRRIYPRAKSDSLDAHAKIFQMTPIHDNENSLHNTVQERDSSVEPRNDNDQMLIAKPSIRTKWFSGWRTGVYSAICFSCCSLVINLSANIWLAKHPSSDPTFVEVCKGGCDNIARTDTWVHLVINILSTILLAGSNYCMQCLCAPNRREIDKAHARGRFLDIGVPSLRNLSSIATCRMVMWGLLALSSIPLHLMYNSAFFTSLSTYDYKITVLSSSFDPDTYGVGFQRLSPLLCLEAYAQVFLSEHRDLVLVTRYNSSGSSLLNETGYSSKDAIAALGEVYKPYDWICAGNSKLYAKNKPDAPDYFRTPCDSYVDRVKASIDNWRPFDYDFDYCLSEPIEGQCSFYGNIPIIATVIACNLIKVMPMAILAFRLTGRSLVTIGDALESFLEVPDKTTKNICLFSRNDTVRCEKSARSRCRDGQPFWAKKKAKKHESAKLKALRWTSAASRRRWACSIASIVTALVVVTMFLIFAMLVTDFAVMSLGFGIPHVSAVISGLGINNLPSPVIAVIFVANLPQLILSVLYFNLNGLFTSMWVAREWSKFASERKFLRVSTPQGHQRSTHFLQLPYKVGVPLMIISGLLHWCVSRSIFLVVVFGYERLGLPGKGRLLIISCGFSPLAMICVLGLGCILTITTILIGRRRYVSSMPLAGSCSVAISAACHRPDWNVDASVCAVKWGVVPVKGNTDVGHCCFTSGDVEPIQDGKRYAGYIAEGPAPPK